MGSVQLTCAPLWATRSGDVHEATADIDGIGCGAGLAADPAHFGDRHRSHPVLQPWSSTRWQECEIEQLPAGGVGLANNKPENTSPPLRAPYVVTLSGEETVKADALVFANAMDPSDLIFVGPRGSRYRPRSS